jgi:hypothetical protein
MKNALRIAKELEFSTQRLEHGFSPDRGRRFNGPFNRAAAVDIGLLGERLFDRDIIRELYAGDGILWDITRKSGIS